MQNVVDKPGSTRERRQGDSQRPSRHRTTMTLTACARLLFFMGALINPALAANRNSTAPAEHSSADVYQQVGVLRNDIEQIRAFLGKRGPRARTFKIANAEPRQVYFQAQTLFRKCNHLALEYKAASREIAPPAPENTIAPADVFQLVTAAHQQLLAVKKALGIDTASVTPRFERRRQSSDVLHDIVEAGNVLNRLIDNPADWTSIYDRAIQMLTYVGGALPKDTRYPALAPFECCAQPEDVYQSFATSLRALQPAAASVGQPLLKVTRVRAPEGGASTATVYDLTTTMVSDIGELSLRLEGSEDIQPPGYARPARILPAHALQLSKVLTQQIEQLTASLNERVAITEHQR